MGKADTAVNEPTFEDLVKDAAVVEVGNAPMDKVDLVGVPFIITNIKFHEDGKFDGKPWVQVNILLQDNTKASFSDGSTGVFSQLSEYDGKYPRLIPSGLRVSNYKYEGKDTQTYYLT